MKRIDFRIALGTLLILLGGLLFVERLGFLKGAASLFWGVVLILAGAYFLYLFVQNVSGSWWAIIPGLTLVAMGGENFLPKTSVDWGGALFLGAIGLSFWVIYLMDRSRWWGIIPGGVLLTLAAITLVDDMNRAIDSGSLLFLGLGLTFLLVAILPNPHGKTGWAYIPAVVLVLMGAFIGSTSTVGLVSYVWPVALILVGLIVVFRFFTSKA
jgi:hypothetical protein